MTARAPSAPPPRVELDLEVPPEEEDGAIAALWASGSAGSWTVRPGLVRAYFDGDGAGVEDRFRDAWREMTGTEWRGTLRARPAFDRDWLASWRASVVPIPVTPTLTVAPPGSDPGPGRTVVIDPGQGFGTGSHPTTRSLLCWLERDPGARVLDVGCGSGVLGIAALLCGARFAVGLDIDEEAIANANGNRRRNGVAGSLRLIAGTLDAVTAGARFDRVLANLDGPTLDRLADALVARCSPGGRVGVAGLLLGERDAFLRSVDGLAVELADERTDVDAGSGDTWWSGWLARREER